VAQKRRADVRIAQLEVESRGLVGTASGGPNSSVQCYGGLFLTYPQFAPTDTTVDLNIWLTILKAQLTGVTTDTVYVDKAILAKEKHEDGSWHLHAWIHFAGVDEMHRIRVPHRLLKLNGKSGNYQGARSDIAVVKYCTKDGDYIFEGMTDPRARAECRTRHLNLVLADVLANKITLQQAVTEKPSLMVNLDKLERNLSLMKTMAATRPEGWKPLLIFIQGPPGVGKSTIANSLTSPEDTYLVPLPSSKESPWWFDGIAGQRQILFDNVSAAVPPPYDLLCQMANPTACRLPVKGAHVQCLPWLITVTSTQSPKEIWKNLDHQMMRRMTTYLIGEYVPASSTTRQKSMTTTEMTWMLGHPDQDLPVDLLSNVAESTIPSHQVRWHTVDLSEFQSLSLPGETVRALSSLHAHLRSSGFSVPQWHPPQGLLVTTVFDPTRMAPILDSGVVPLTPGQEVGALSPYVDPTPDNPGDLNSSVVATFDQSQTY